MRPRKRLYFKKVSRPVKVNIDLNRKPATSVLYLVEAATGAAVAVGRAVVKFAESLKQIKFEPISSELTGFLKGEPLQMEGTLTDEVQQQLLAYFTPGTI